MEEKRTFYKSFLPGDAATSDSESRMIYMYDKIISGFAARLTKNDLDEMSKKDGFVAAFPNRIYTPQTTHTPQFLGLNIQNGAWNKSNYGEGIIIGVFDSGVFPDHPSFSDEGMPKPPAKWAGQCDFNTSACNNKLIGARTFMNGNTGAPPFDDVGHGTHTSSTAAGASVASADVLENAKGIASGVAPKAHIAIYKVCDIEGCQGIDILAAMEAAISDGVNVMSLSLGGGPQSFYDEPIAMGAFRAVQQGIFVSCAAGNNGPYVNTVSNEAPWVLTVAASTMDRSIRSTVKLGNGLSYNGESLNQNKSFKPDLYPLVYAADNSNKDPAFARYCGEEALDGFDVKGKIVVCDRGGIVGRVEKGSMVLKAGGAGMILVNGNDTAYTTLADPHVLPASHVSAADGEKIKVYINSTKNATATFLFQGTLLGTSPAPAIADFSSRGPGMASQQGTLKPDITGPGVSVLAAWPNDIALSSSSDQYIFNVISGTSMSTPHLSGIAALIKAAHPDWSPAAIKSAMMTTADTTDNNGSLIVDERLLPANAFAVGAGHVNPTKALDPGLVYDITPNDYMTHLCGFYGSDQVGIIAGSNVDCNSVIEREDLNLNYPSIFVPEVENKTSVTVARTVTNVGESNSNYSLKIDAPPGVNVTVQPDVLQFTKANQEIKFSITFDVPKPNGTSFYTQGSLSWISDKHTVRSPIVICLIC
ncbi:putative tripeptidyl-peptidase II [Dioscorea sansibarensis]